MFVKSTRFKQVCQLLLSLIVSTQKSTAAVYMAQLGSNQSERRKDNRAIVFWVTCLISIGYVINFSCDLKWTNQKAATPNCSPGPQKWQDNATGSQWETHCIGNKIGFFGLTHSWEWPGYIRDMGNVLVTSRPPFYLQIQQEFHFLPNSLIAVRMTRFSVRVHDTFVKG